VLREIYDGHVWATSAITCWMALLISWTVNLAGIEMASGRCWLHAEIEFSVNSALPATSTAVLFTRDVKTAVDLSRFLLVAGLWANAAIYRNQPTAISAWLTAMITFQCCFGIQASELKWKTRELFLAQYAIIVVVQGNEKRFQQHQFLNRQAPNFVPFGRG